MEVKEAWAVAEEVPLVDPGFEGIGGPRGLWPAVAGGDGAAKLGDARPFSAGNDLTGATHSNSVPWHDAREPLCRSPDSSTNSTSKPGAHADGTTAEEPGIPHQLTPS
jgi:hypothetical protein